MARSRQSQGLIWISSSWIFYFSSKDIISYEDDVSLHVPQLSSFCYCSTYSVYFILSVWYIDMGVFLFMIIRNGFLVWMGCGSDRISKTQSIFRNIIWFLVKHDRTEVLYIIRIVKKFNSVFLFPLGQLTTSTYYMLSNHISFTAQEIFNVTLFIYFFLLFTCLLMWHFLCVALIRNSISIF